MTVSALERGTRSENVPCGMRPRIRWSKILIFTVKPRPCMRSIPNELGTRQRPADGPHVEAAGSGCTSAGSRATRASAQACRTGLAHFDGTFGKTEP